MVETSPDLLSLSDPYTGYTALHWAAKVSYKCYHHIFRSFKKNFFHSLA